MDVICNNDSLKVLRNDKYVFEISLSQNNLINYLRVGNITHCHSFDDDYDYDHKTQQDWEIHGKISKELLNDVINNINTEYEFYYSNEISAKFIHTENCFKITYNSWEFDENVYDVCMFTSEEFSMFKKELKNLISS